jgi:hypothetical protein
MIVNFCNGSLILFIVGRSTLLLMIENIFIDKVEDFYNLKTKLKLTIYFEGPNYTIKHKKKKTKTKKVKLLNILKPFTFSWVILVISNRLKGNV